MHSGDNPYNGSAAHRSSFSVSPALTSAPRETGTPLSGDPEVVQYLYITTPLQTEASSILSPHHFELIGIVQASAPGGPVRPALHQKYKSQFRGSLPRFFSSSVYFFFPLLLKPWVFPSLSSVRRVFRDCAPCLFQISLDLH